MVKKRVTVCIPHLVRKNLLKRCLQSLRENVDLPYRIIIINDGKRPLTFSDSRIEVVNSPTRMPVGAKKKLFAKLVETEYLFRLDNDMLIRPKSLEAQVKALDLNPSLAAVSGISLTRGKPPWFPGVADFKFVGKFILKKKYTIHHILTCNSDLFRADFIPTGYTTFRIKALEEISFDTNYKLGYSHWDTFLQFYFTAWECAVHKKSYFDHIHHESPTEYLAFYSRGNAPLIEASRKYFVQKWGYRPVDLREKTVVGKALFNVDRLLTYLRCKSFVKNRLSTINGKYKA